MSIGLKCLTDKLNLSLNDAASLSVAESAQVMSAVNTLASNTVDSVPCVACLPPASQNTGRMIYVCDISAYRYSNGYYWINDFSTTPRPQTRSLIGWTFYRTLAIPVNCIVPRSVPSETFGSLRTWTSIVGQCYAAAGLKTDSTLWIWGDNTAGRIGSNNTVVLNCPTTPSGGGTNWCGVSTSQTFTAGVKKDGTLWTWGCNSAGQLGIGTTTNRSSPGTTQGGGINWCSVSTGGNAGLAIKTDGTLWSWGCNNLGQLGDNSATNRSSPVAISGGGVNWCGISTYCVSAAVKTDGTLWTWGRGTYGALGDNQSAAHRSSPGTTQGGGTNWCRSSAGWSNVVAVKTDGTLWAWGRNHYGQIGNGDGTTALFTSPVEVAGGGTTWCLPASTSTFSAGIKTDGTLWTWGFGGYGRLGNGSYSNSSSPATVVGYGGTWSNVALFCKGALAISKSATNIGF